MARPGQIDHTQSGLDEVPEKLAQPRVLRYLSVYLRQFDSIEDAAQRTIDAFIQWRTSGAQLTFVLDIIGSLLDQPRPDGFSNAEYAFVLQARVLVRRSSATREDVRRVAVFLARGNPVAVFGIAPKIMIVEFIDLTLTAQEETLYTQLLLGAIDAVDKLVITYATASTAHYDVGLYDQDLYA